MAKEKLDDEFIKKLNSMGTFTAKQDYVSTDFPFLDNFVAGYPDIEVGRGGFPRTRWVSFAGESGVGKTTIVMEAVSRMLKKGYRIVYQDIENGINENLLECFDIRQYAAENAEQFISGEKSFYSYSPFTFSESLTSMRKIVMSCKVDVMIVDSFKQLAVDESYLNGESMESGGQLMKSNQLQGDYFPAIRSMAKHYNFAGIGIQQARIKKEGMFFVLRSAGGNAYEHNLDIRFFIKEKQKIVKKAINNLGEEVEKHCGNFVEIKSEKSRFGMHNVTIPVIFGRGISLIQMYKKVLEAEGYLSTPKGSRYTYIRVPGTFDENHEKWDSTKSFVAFKNDEIIDQIKNNFAAIEKFIYENKLIYIEKEKE